ncbi:glycosyltransferase family 9 protein [Pseudodesulfovibrio sp.]|nr:glycosyltransferase family 9 protein [Pseudodesulfovibrio sp.]
MINKADIKKILLLRMDRIGDMFCTTPAFRALREAYPDAQIDLVASEGNWAVVQDNPHIDRLFTFPLKQMWQWPYHFLRYKFGGYDLVVAFNAQSKTTSRMVKFINAPHSVGTWDRRTEGYYDQTVRYRDGDHTIDFQMQVAAELGAPSDNTAMVFPVSEALLERAQVKYPRREGKKRVAVFIGNAKKVDTRWPEGNFVELVERMTARGDVEVHIVAGPGDEVLLDGFSWTDDCVLYPGGSLQELGAFLKTCDVFVTSSSGPMHLAAAVDAPMVAILADYTYTCWRPLSDIHRIVQSGQEGVQVGDVTVDAVLEAVEAKLGS